MHIQFCGAAREVTGSCHLLTLDNGFKILLDCGLYQGYDEAMEKFNTTWFFQPSDINCMVLSHAHIDHTGRMPKLIADGFKGTIYATHATRDLSALMLLDSAGIQEKDAEYAKKKAQQRGESDVNIEALYTAEDVTATLKAFAAFAYDTWFPIHEDVDVYFSDAGHILGSASVTLRIKENGKTTMFGFSGDIGRPNRPILRDPQPMPPCDYLICESTYGDRLHEAAPDELNKFAQVLRDTCVTRGGMVLIPAFSVGRTQEIVYMLDRLVTAGLLPSIPVYVDSPLAVNATEVFVGHPECFDEDLNKYIRTDPNPFGFNNLHYLRTAEESKALNEKQEPCIIIASSGMANAGRIKHHLSNHIGDARNTVLIVGYASPQTPAGQLRDGKKTLKLFGDVLTVKAKVEVMDSFSAHADYQEILTFLENQKKSLQQIFLVHGDYEVQQVFQKTLNQNGFANVQIPTLGDIVMIK
jgi:metallo-beta-lactamase family protein